MAVQEKTDLLIAVDRNNPKFILLSFMEDPTRKFAIQKGSQLSEKIPPEKTRIKFTYNLGNRWGFIQTLQLVEESKPPAGPLPPFKTALEIAKPDIKSPAAESQEISDRYSLGESFKIVGPLHPIIVDATTHEILSGNDRFKANPDWPVEPRECKDNVERALVKIHANYQRRISKEERVRDLTHLAEALEKQGTLTAHIAQRVSQLTTFSERYIQELLPSKYKRAYSEPTVVEKDKDLTSTCKSEPSTDIQVHGKPEPPTIGFVEHGKEYVRSMKEPPAYSDLYPDLTAVFDKWVKHETFTPSGEVLAPGRKWLIQCRDAVIQVVMEVLPLG